MTTLTNNDFITHILGQTEQEFRTENGWSERETRLTKFNMKEVEELEEWASKHPARSAIFQGMHLMLSVGEAGEELELKDGGSFKIRFFNPVSPKETDIRAMQADPKNKNALFQIASTAYALEGGMSKGSARLTSMLTSPVQGEWASIGTAAATIGRKYFFPTYNEGQQTYLLYNLTQKGILTRGPFRIDDYRIVGARGFEPYSYDPDHIQDVSVVYHGDIQVTSGYGGSAKNDPLNTLPLDSDQRVSQLFTTAANLNPYRGRGKPVMKITQPMLDFAQLMLDASYEGTIKTGIRYLHKKCVLTLMGGGAFRNQLSTITSAIKRNETLIKASGMENLLIFYPDRFGRPGAVRSAAGDIKEIQGLIEFADKINNTKFANLPKIQEAIRDYCNTSYFVDIRTDREASYKVATAAEILNSIFEN